MPVGGGPVPSGGNEPVSIAVHGDLVYVANAGDGAAGYTGFTLNPGGWRCPTGRRPETCSSTATAHASPAPESERR